MCGPFSGKRWAAFFALLFPRKDRWERWRIDGMKHHQNLPCLKISIFSSLGIASQEGSRVKKVLLHRPGSFWKDIIPCVVTLGLLINTSLPAASPVALAADPVNYPSALDALKQAAESTIRPPITVPCRWRARPAA